MEIRKDLELIDVKTDDTGERAYFNFLDVERGTIQQVSFNRQVWSEELGGFMPDKEKAKKVDEWMDTYFGLTWDTRGDAVGCKKDIYCYDNFNSLWECTIVEKFDVSENGLLFNTFIEEIVDDGNKIVIRFKCNDKLYQSKMNYSEYSEVQKKYYPDRIKQQRVYTKFADKYGCDIKDADTLVGKPITVEVKVARRKYPYCDIKKPDWN